MHCVVGVCVQRVWFLVIWECVDVDCFWGVVVIVWVGWVGG